MKRSVKWAGAGVFGLAFVFGLVWFVGYQLPVRHYASRAVGLAAPPERVFAVIADFSNYPEWRSDVDRVDVTRGWAGYPLVREFGSNGEIPYQVEVSQPGVRLVTRIADPALPFGGRWMWELRRTRDGGTELQLTEYGEIYNPVFRCFARFVFGYHATIDTYLADLDAHLRSTS